MVEPEPTRETPIEYSSAFLRCWEKWAEEMPHIASQAEKLIAFEFWKAGQESLSVELMN